MKRVPAVPRPGAEATPTGEPTARTARTINNHPNRSQGLPRNDQKVMTVPKPTRIEATTLTSKKSSDK